MFPTRLQVKDRFLSLLDDPLASVYTDAVFQPAFAEAYDILFSAFLNQQVPRVENVVDGIIVPPYTYSLTPAAMGIADFADWEWLAERTSGSTDKFIDLVDEDRLTQRAPTDRLLETVWQNNAFQFVGATTVRELQLKYVASGEAPTLDATVIGIDSSLVFLSNYAVGVAGGRKGDDEIANRCMGLAVGPKFNLGTIGGELFRLTQPLVRSRQNVVVAHRPYTTQQRIWGRRGVPYVAVQAGTTGGGSQNSPVQFTTADGTITPLPDGVNATFWLSLGVLSFSLYRNGLLQTLTTDYNASNNEIVFLPASIPASGDLISAVGYPIY